MSIRKISGYWILVSAMTALMAVLAYFKGAGLDPSPVHRVGAVVLIGVIVLLLRAPLAGAWRVVARNAPGQSAKHYRDPMARAGAARKEGPVDLNLQRREVLQAMLHHRHGWRWRYRERWVLVAGDEPLVRRLAPGLVDNGYAIAGDMVLLYARQTGQVLDTDWLGQIRRLRRRRPVDAVVAVTYFRDSAASASASAPDADADDLAQSLARYSRCLRWAAPTYLLNVTDFGSNAPVPDHATGFTWSSARVKADEMATSVQRLAHDLSDAGVARLAHNPHDSYLAELSRHIAHIGGALSELVMQMARSRYWNHAIYGLLFTPLLNERDLTQAASGDAHEAGEPMQSQRPLHQPAVWQTIATHSRHLHGRRVGFSFSTTTAWLASALAGLWIAGTMLSGFTNRAIIQSASVTATKLSTRQDATQKASQTTTQDATQSAQTLDTLQKQLDTLEIRQRDGAPWYTRFGLNRDAALFAALWPSYSSAASRTVVTPIREKLEGRLQQLASLSDAEIASGGEEQIEAAYATLKTYLMLARPDRADAQFLIPQLIATAAPARPLNSSLSEGAWQDLHQRLLAFYANHLRQQRVTPGGSSLAIVADAGLVNGARQTVIGVRGIQNSIDATYQQVINEANPKYPPVSLAVLLGDASSRGLFNTTATVPGVFTRTAWEERVSKAIDEASEQRTVAGDWVLSDTKSNAPAGSSLKAELRQRYFDNYARAWEQFLNSVRWQPATTLSGTVDQLTLLADPQRSPLTALMNVVVYQAGAGASTHSLSDTLVNRAQQLVGATEKDPSKVTQPQNTAPLASAFGPLLLLAGSDLVNGGDGGGTGKAVIQAAPSSELSVPRYMERVTAMRLKLQQIIMGNDPDAMSRAAAQAVLQGRTSDIADSRDYASRVAASLGQQWAGFGDLFQQPLDQTWQVVLQPAASSLNDTWRNGVLADWNRNFGGRYPFADSDNDASLPEMARFMRPDSGMITQFVITQLAGVVERQGDRWVPAQGSGHHSLAIDPAFLTALNTLMRVSTSLFPSGDARVRFELRAVPTPGITEMRFMLSGRDLHYFNQKEEWTPFIWPGDTLENRSRIEWQTQEGGLRSALDTQGRFGLIRLLERATVAPQDNARYLLAWTPDQSQGIPLKVQLRSEAGAGPLDVLALRHFSLPQRIFLTGSSQGAQKQALGGPPPLPAAMLESARLSEVPLPSGLPGRADEASHPDAAPLNTHMRATADAAQQTRPVTPRIAENATPPVAGETAPTTTSLEPDEGKPLSESKPPRTRRPTARATRADRLLADAFAY